MLSLKDIAEISLDRVERDKDLAICVTGFEGDGKSTLAIGLGLEIDPHFELERNVLFFPSVSELKKKIFNLPRYTPIVADEAINIMYKLNWGLRKQKYLSQLYAVCRNQNKISIFCMPRFTDLLEYFRNHRVKVWIHIIGAIDKKTNEGTAVVLSRSWNPISTDPWGLKVFNYLLEKQRKGHKKDSEYDIEDKLALFSQMSSFVDVLNFGWIDNNLWKSYLNLKSKINVNEEDFFEQSTVEKQRDDYKKMILTSVKTFIALGYSKSAISRLLKTHPNSIASWIKADETQRAIEEFNKPI